MCFLFSIEINETAKYSQKRLPIKELSVRYILNFAHLKGWMFVCDIKSFQRSM